MNTTNAAIAFAGKFGHSFMGYLKNWEKDNCTKFDWKIALGESFAAAAIAAGMPLPIETIDLYASGCAVMIVEVGKVFYKWIKHKL